MPFLNHQVSLLSFGAGAVEPGTFSGCWAAVLGFQWVSRMRLHVVAHLVVARARPSRWVVTRVQHYTPGIHPRPHVTSRLPAMLACFGLVHVLFCNLTSDAQWCLGISFSMGKVPLSPLLFVIDVYTRFYSCRQCWASKCRGL
jgi:hypothetical protein